MGATIITAKDVRKMCDTRVTVLLSTYNGEKYLEQQIESLFHQKNVEVDILVRDDGSTDGTFEILERYSRYENFSWYKGEKNLGSAKSFLELVQRAELENEYYAFCDQDDVWLENKLETALQKLKGHAQEAALYYSEVERVNSRLEKMPKQFKKYHTEKFGGAFVATAAGGCTMVWNKKHMTYLKKHNPDYVTMHDEWNLFVALAVKAYVYYDENSYILYRQHENNVLGGIRKHQMSKWGLLKYRVEKLLNSSRKPTWIAQELLNGYQEEMDVDGLKLCKKVLHMNKTLLHRVKAIFDRELKSPYFVMNMKFWIQVLRGRA